jgi:hypothetical protein
MHGALPPTHRIVFIALFLRNPHTKKDLLIIWSSVQAAIMHGAARINYTAGKLTAHCLLQHVGKWGINNCTAFYCRLGISLNNSTPYLQQGSFVIQLLLYMPTFTAPHLANNRNNTGTF